MYLVEPRNGITGAAVLPHRYPGVVDEPDGVVSDHTPFHTFEVNGLSGSLRPVGPVPTRQVAGSMIDMVNVAVFDRNGSAVNQPDPIPEQTPRSRPLVVAVDLNPPDCNIFTPVATVARKTDGVRSVFVTLEL